jgi:hypothetical protein
MKPYKNVSLPLRAAASSASSASLTLWKHLSGMILVETLNAIQMVFVDLGLILRNPPLMFPDPRTLCKFVYIHWSTVFCSFISVVCLDHVDAAPALVR